MLYLATIFVIMNSAFAADLPPAKQAPVTAPITARARVKFFIKANLKATLGLGCLGAAALLGVMWFRPIPKEEVNPLLDEEEQSRVEKMAGVIERFGENRLESQDYMKMATSAFIFPSMLYTAGKLFYSAVQDLKLCFGGLRAQGTKQEARSAKNKAAKPVSVKKKEEPKSASSQPMYF